MSKSLDAKRGCVWFSSRRLSLKGGQLPSLPNPEIVQRGFVFDETSGDILEAARNLVMLSLRQSAEDEVTDPAVLEQTIRSTLRKHFWEATQRKPQIVPVVMEV